MFQFESKDREKSISQLKGCPSGGISYFENGQHFVLFRSSTDRMMPTLERAICVLLSSQNSHRNTQGKKVVFGQISGKLLAQFAT